MTGAIEFLKHARDYCDNVKCKDCKFYDKCQDIIPNCELLRKINDTKYKAVTDNDIADLVREVERWWKNEKRNNHNQNVL